MIPRRERWAWAMYDFANSGYATVVLTAIYSAYFVGVVAGDLGTARATLYWTVAVALSNALVFLTAPLIGAAADARASRKRFLAFATVGCVGATALLGLAGPGAVGPAMLLVVLSNVAFGTAEDLIAAFLPELAPPGERGRLSALGWSLGYMGGLLVLGLCLAYITWAQARGRPPTVFVPISLLIVAATYGLATLPTFAFLKERSLPARSRPSGGYLAAGWRRLRRTLDEASRFEDLFRFLLALLAYTSGIYTVIVLAAVYAQEAMGFTAMESLRLILVVNLTAAVGAFAGGQLQDRLGSVPTLLLTVGLWVVAILTVVLDGQSGSLWVAANLMGLALGSSQSAGRALVAGFTPLGREAEFFGLWGLAVKLSAVLGPLSYGAVVFLSGGNHRWAILSTLLFFLLGLGLLWRVDERRGEEVARLLAGEEGGIMQLPEKEGP